MRFLKHLIKIYDIFYISESIKDINPYFEIFYNKMLKHFEVHDISKQNSFVVSFENYPNQNLVLKLQKSSSKNAKEIFKEIENSNKKITKNNKDKIIKQTDDCLSEIFRFGEKTTSDISRKQIKNIIEKG